MIPSLQDTLTSEETERFSRQLILPSFGTEGQLRLKRSSVLCIGAGGLGSPILTYLTAAGVGEITLVDPDIVSLSNLQRQTLHTPADLNLPKTLSAENKLLALNPNLKLTLHSTLWEEKTVNSIYTGQQLIIDASDNFQSRFLSNTLALREKIPFIYGAISHFQGQASTFAPWIEGGCYACMFPTPPPQPPPPGVIGALPGIIGSIQALEAIKYLSGSGDLLLGKLFHIDTLTFKSGLLNLKRNPHCPQCNHL